MQDPRTNSPLVFKEHSLKRRNFLSLILSNHLRALKLCSKRLLHKPFATLTILLMIAIALALPTGLYTMLQSLQGLSQNINDSTQISLYLKNTTTDQQAQQFLQTLQSQPGIEKATYISPAQGLKEFQQSNGFEDVLGALRTNPLPGVIVVEAATVLRTPDAIDQLARTLKQSPYVESTQVDMQWVKRLFSIIAVGKRVVFILAALLSLGVLLIIGNLIRMTTAKYHNEIDVMKLVGANRSYIRKPFLYTGFLYGLLGGLLALCIIVAIAITLQAPIQQLTGLYQSQYILTGPTIRIASMLLISSSLLGLFAAWWALFRRL